MRVAQAYEQSGDYRSAARIWQGLYNADASNDNYFFGVVRCLKALDNYAALTDIVEAKLQKKRSVKVLIIYAQVLTRTGRQPDANDIWKEAIANTSKSVSLYKEIAQAQLEVHSFDLAVSTLLKARSDLDDDAIFADELAQMYAVRGDYKNGVTEVLRAFRQSPNLQLAEGRLSAFMTNDTASTYVRSEIASEAKSHDDNLAMLRLYEWLLRESKRYTEALDVVRRLDELQRKQGRELLTFADQCRMDGQYDVASTAYSDIISLGRKSGIAEYAAFGYAACLEARLSSVQGLSNKEIDQVQSLYEQLVKDFPRTNTAADALLHQARIQDQLRRNPERAAAIYEAIIREYRDFEQSAQASLELGTVLVQQDRLPEAADAYRAVESMTDARNQNLNFNAAFLNADLLFYRGLFDSAATAYEQVSQNTESEVANDAIERLTFIRMHRQDSVQLQRVATAMLRVAQRRDSIALEIFHQLATQKQDMDLAEYCCYQAADLLYDRKRYTECRVELDRLAGINPETIYGDRVLFLYASCYEAEGRKAEAIQAYQDLLAKFPRSLFVQDAREHIRKLRANS